MINRKFLLFYLKSWMGALLIYALMASRGFVLAAPEGFLVFGLFFSTLLTAIKGIRLPSGRFLLGSLLALLIWSIFFEMSHHNFVPLLDAAGNLLPPQSELSFWIESIAGLKLGALISLALLIVSSVLFFRVFYSLSGTHHK